MTNIPQELADALSVSLSAITADGELPAAVRRELLRLIETLSSAEHGDAGYLRRVRLAMLCAEEAIDWLNPYANVLTAARTILANGADALAGKYDLVCLERDNGVYHTRVIDLFEHGEAAFVPVYAGMTVFAAINTILYDTNFDAVGENEKNVCPDDWDAGYYGALALSGSAVWEEKGGDASRRLYWRWYLEKAVPRAWDVLAPLPFKRVQANPGQSV
ncbi:Imm5 family immunity protein [Burkholderia arboris]|uniref:Imm5 family immunity protein n=1 Tax=Burkholderia arboris TaxID=488730 RepID=UPI00210C0EA9|nr:Imm5 family immunity protein [Burkholderia arboris]UTV58246.1 Imm5 family immunity protein [Burkholderia arboris]